MKYHQLETLSTSLSPEEFFKTYISKRQPVKIKGLPEDESFKARAWTDLNHLAEKAGDSQVLIEPMHPESHQFGTDVERIKVSFRDFLQSLQDDEGPHHYLTTQYADVDLDEHTVVPPPADVLTDDYPSVPRIMGNLSPQQVNLWVGRSEEGSTSGLHHDFHDNLYCLLRGRKRFILYPPEEVHNMYPYGTLEVIHDNGSISYLDAPVRPDGLTIRGGLKARVKAIEQKLEAVPIGKGKGRRDTKERKILLKAYDDALDELAQYTLEAGDGVEVEDEVDDFDALMASLEEESSEDLADIDDDAESDDDENEDEDEEDEETEEEDGEDEGDEEVDDEAEETGQDMLLDDEETESSEPPSFSRIPTALVHQHLGLPTTAVVPPGASNDFPNLQKTSAPYVVELNAGEMLYLPAAWWHEVTSYSSADDPQPIHMAFNYWLYPPTNLDDFDDPYEDTLIWDYFRSEQNKEHTPKEDVPVINTKRKGGDVDESKNRESKRSRV
ncbi:cupin-like domain-containing protein [Irpex rosettiformis]|uniref:Cupin-like domain-containing protein n=1 Tax=Irpex rosettiformis TaxID=378272 RepID=A0ACB8UDM6_9APHY|nr:cupin-like domain-containing protein [Irpex rosettiformis]